MVLSRQWLPDGNGFVMYTQVGGCCAAAVSQQPTGGGVCSWHDGRQGQLQPLRLLRPPSLHVWPIAAGIGQWHPRQRRIHSGGYSGCSGRQLPTLHRTPNACCCLPTPVGLVLGVGVCRRRRCDPLLHPKHRLRWRQELDWPIFSSNACSVIALRRVECRHAGMRRIMEMLLPPAAPACCRGPVCAGAGAVPGRRPAQQ